MLCYPVGRLIYWFIPIALSSLRSAGKNNLSHSAILQEFDGEVNDAMDDEETLVEQEEHEEKDYDNELQDLKDEGMLINYAASCSVTCT